MKKLGKLTINPSKVMKNEDLVSLKGGYSKCTCNIVWGPDGEQTSMSGLNGYGRSCNDAANALYYYYPDAISIACE